MRTNLVVPFAEHELVRKLGARWDDVRKTWYAENVSNMIDFMRWMPDHLAGSTSRAIRKVAYSKKGNRKCK